MSERFSPRKEKNNLLKLKKQRLIGILGFGMDYVQISGSAAVVLAALLFVYVKKIKIGLRRTVLRRLHTAEEGEQIENKT